MPVKQPINLSQLEYSSDILIQHLISRLRLFNCYIDLVTISDHNNIIIYAI
jgi:hypothetical protein